MPHALAHSLGRKFRSITEAAWKDAAQIGRASRSPRRHCHTGPEIGRQTAASRARCRGKSSRRAGVEVGIGTAACEKGPEQAWPQPSKLHPTCACEHSQERDQTSQPTHWLPMVVTYGMRRTTGPSCSKYRSHWLLNPRASAGGRTGSRRAARQLGSVGLGEPRAAGTGPAIHLPQQGCNKRTEKKERLTGHVAVVDQQLRAPLLGQAPRGLQRGQHLACLHGPARKTKNGGGN